MSRIRKSIVLKKEELRGAKIRQVGPGTVAVVTSTPAIMFYLNAYASQDETESIMIGHSQRALYLNSGREEVSKCTVINSHCPTVGL